MLLFGFYHDVDLELSWISEHIPASGSTGYDKSLAGAISLMQKHKVPAGPPSGTINTRLFSSGQNNLFALCSQELQAEVTAHQKHLNTVLEKGRSLTKSSKSDGEEVLQRCLFLPSHGRQFSLHFM